MCSDWLNFEHEILFLIRVSSTNLLAVVDFLVDDLVLLDRESAEYDLSNE